MLNLFNRRPSIRVAVAELERSGIAGDIRERLAEFLEQSQEYELFHFNPHYLGEYLNLAERPTLKLLLAAVYEGVVAMHWDLQCPACGNFDHRHDELTQLHRDMQCSFCLSIYDPRLDQEVRVTFSPHPRLRQLSPEANDPAFRREIDERLGVVPGMAMLTLPDFQRLFPQQHLPPQESLDVMRLALLFTDLAGSTALYARRGDPRAYHLVRLHFDALFQVVEQHGGAVVKTIGDAVLGVFQMPGEAMECALQMQQAIYELNESRNLEGDERLILKVGLHSGPSLSVTLNDRPDYFGTTVNIAARVQGLSKGQDVVFTEAVYNERDVRLLLEGRLVQKGYVQLKGIDEQVLAYRLALDEA